MLAADYLTASGEHRDVLNAYRMFAHDKGWVRRMEASIDIGLAAEVAVEKEQSATRTRMSRAADPYLRERLHDLDDLSNRLLRLLSGDQRNGRELPDDAILVARNIGPGELLDYGRKLRGVVLEEGSVGSHAAIVARALAIPLVIQAARITREALNGDAILVDGDQGHVHLRPEETVAKAFREKIDMLHEAQAAYAALRDKPATTRDGVTLSLYMNAGLMADLPSLPKCGAVGVGLFRTELQFLIRTTVPKRTELAALYARILDAARDKPVVFRTLDIGSDKVLPYMKRADEPNPALGWRAIRVGLDRPGIMRMQVQALIRGAKGRPLLDHVPLRRRGRRVRGRARPRPRRAGARARPRPHRAARAQDRRDARDPEPRLRARTASSSSPTSSRSAATTSSSSSSPPTARTSWCAAATTCCARASSTSSSRSSPAAPRTARRSRSAARTPAARSRRWRSPPSASAASRCARPRSARSRRCCARSTSPAPAPSSTPPARAGAAQRPPGARGLAARDGRAALRPLSALPPGAAAMIYALTLLFFCQLAGEVAGARPRRRLPRPGARHGPALRRPRSLRGRSAPALDAVADTLLRNLSLLFVPAAVGVVQQAGLIAANWLAISAAHRRLDGPHAHRHRLHLPRRGAPGRGAARMTGTRRPLPHLGLSLRDPAPLADRDARRLRHRRRRLRRASTATRSPTRW